MRAMGLRRIPRLLLAGLVTTTTLATTSTALAAGGAGTPVLAFGSCGISHASLMLDMGGTGASAVVVLPDGKMLVAGIGGFPDPVTLVRLLPDGTLDVSFGHNGGTVTTLFEPGGPSNRAIIKEMAVQPDGRIVLVGASVRYDNPTQHLLFLRYLPDGTPDASFGDAGQVLFPDMGVGEALTVMPDGKLLAAAQGKLVRLVSSGRLDPTFGSGGVLGPGVPGWVLDMALQPDGNVVLGFSPDSDGGIGVARIHPDGTPDLGFGTNGASAVRIPLSYITSIAVDSAGRIVAAGGGSQDHVHVIVTRHLSDGRLDESFGDGGVSQQWFPGTAESEAIDVIVQADGKPVVAARLFDPPVNDFLRARMGLVRLTSTGGPDPSFGTGGFVVAREGNIDQKTNALAATADGGSVVVGTGPVMIRYRGDGPSSVEIPALTPQTCSREAQLTGPADFGTYPVHTTSGLHTFTLTATGPRPVVVNRVGSSEEQFVVRSTTCNGARLARGTSCTVSVVFEATKDGSFYEAVVVWTDAGVSWQSAEANGTAFVSPVGWGWNGLGQLGSGQGAQSLVAGAPTSLRYAVSLSAGYHHTLALTSYGAIFAWGWNHFGQLGIGCSYTTSCEPALEPRPVAVPTNLQKVKAVAAGGFHSLALLENGTVLSWGFNGVGQLGFGTTDAQVSPHPVPGLTDVVAISAGIYHSLAVRSDGSVWAWGWNYFGQLGDGTTTDRPVPTRVPGLTGVTAVAGGGYHSLALANGTVQAWGMNNVGQLGDGTVVGRLRPTAVPGLASVSAVAAGGFHSLAVTGTGVSTWGWNAFGQLGDGTTADRAAPSRVAPGTVAAGGLGHTVALQSDGTVTAWGWNVLGQLGDGSTTTRTTPVAVVGMIRATLVSAGALHSLAE